jgi:hypothetical protein
MWFDQDYKWNPRWRSMFQLANMVRVRGFRLQDSHKTHDALNVPIAGMYVRALNALTSTGFYHDRESLESFFNCFGWNINQKFKTEWFWQNNGYKI